MIALPSAVGISLPWPADIIIYQLSLSRILSSSDHHILPLSSLPSAYRQIMIIHLYVGSMPRLLRHTMEMIHIVGLIVNTRQAALYSSSQFSSSGPRWVFSLTNIVGSSCSPWWSDCDCDEEDDVDNESKVSRFLPTPTPILMRNVDDNDDDDDNLRYIILLLVLHHIN